MIKISPSIMCADLAHLSDEIINLEKSGADYFHVDIMDGVFVPNFSLGLQDLLAIKKITDVEIEVHLMICHADDYIKLFADAGADIIYIHPESCTHLHRTLMKIKLCGKKVGIVLNPATSISILDDVLYLIDFIMIMAVDPGFAGQQFIPATIDKIKRLSEYLEKHSRNIAIAVDGAISDLTIPPLYEAGARIFIAGTSGLFRDSYDYRKEIQNLKNCNAHN